MNGRAAPKAGRGVFSPRLDSFLEQLHAGDTPNSGRFCAYCCNPLPFAFERCDHCGQETGRRLPLDSLPAPVIAMHRRKQKRESLIVNSFAYLGLGLGVAIFIGLVALEYFVLQGLWLLLIAVGVLIVGSWALARIVGGVIGDEVGYRYANRRLAEDWADYLTRRQAGGEGAAR